MYSRSKLSVGIIAGLSTLISGINVAYAQSNDAATSTTSRPTVLEEIIVTSRKRGAESLQNIPATITALGPAVLEAMQVTDFDDFAYQVPGLTFTDNGPGEKRYIIRGIQSAGQQQVAVYYDEVPIPGVQDAGSNSGSQTTDLKIIDMERVEVLKGPQGTIFGANSQSGTVRFITAKPNLEEFEATITPEFSNIEHSDDNSSEISGMINLPLIQGELGLRIVGYDGEEAGYVDNVRLQTKDINSVETEGLRVNLRWAPSDTFTLDTTYWYQDRYAAGSSDYTPYDSFVQFPERTNDPGHKDESIVSTPAFSTFYQTGDYVVGDYTQNFRPDEQEIMSLTGTWDLPWATMTATASRYEREFGFKFDSTWVVTTFDVEGAGRLDLLPALTDQEQRVNQDMLELRFNSVGDGPLQWLIGGFWRERNSEFQSFVPVVDDKGLVFDTGSPPEGETGLPGGGIIGCNPCVFARVADKNIEEKAVFGEMSYRFTDRLEATVGLRWFDVEQSDFGETVFQFALFTGRPPPNEISASEDKVVQKYKLSYDINEDATVYALASQGFRLGGTNNQGLVALPALYESDELWNYELGLKSVWLDNRLIVNAAAYVIEWDNLQVAGRDPTGAFGFIGNAGKAEVKGLELEVTARPSANWDLSAGLSYLPTKELTEDQISSSIIAPGKDGDEIPRIPDLTFNATAHYSFDLPMSGASGWLRGEYSYRDESNTELDPRNIVNRVQEEFSITNLRLGFSSAEYNADLIFFWENVFDEDGDVFVSGGQNPGRPTSKVTNTPRTFGVALTKRF